MIQTPESSQTTNGVSSHRIEWYGKLSKSAKFSHLFELYSAMHASCVDLPLDFKDSSSIASEEHLEPNYYPKQTLGMRADDIEHCYVASKMRHSGYMESARWLDSINMPPLGVRNDKFYIDPEVLFNCRYYTQLNHNKQENQQATLDPTILADIVSGSQDML